MKEKYGNMPNNSKKNRSANLSDTDSGSMGSNHGKTGGQWYKRAASGTV